MNREYLKTFKGISLPLKGADAGGEPTLSISGAPLDYPCESCSMCENESIEKEIARADRWEKVQIVALCVLACAVLFVAGCQGTAHAETMADKYCNAIYIIEGGDKTRHPYGILKKYKTTTPRQACKNTVNNKYKAYLTTDRKVDFVSYLASKYAPIGAENDPTGLNRNWEKNLRFYLARSK